MRPSAAGSSFSPFSDIKANVDQNPSLEDSHPCKPKKSDKVEVIVVFQNKSWTDRVQALGFRLSAGWTPALGSSPKCSTDRTLMDLCVLTHQTGCWFSRTRLDPKGRSCSSSEAHWKSFSRWVFRCSAEAAVTPLLSYREDRRFLWFCWLTRPSLISDPMFLLRTEGLMGTSIKTSDSSIFSDLSLGSVLCGSDGGLWVWTDPFWPQRHPRLILRLRKKSFSDFSEDRCQVSCWGGQLWGFLCSRQQMESGNPAGGGNLSLWSRTASVSRTGGFNG